ncbi:hypothetical protein [Sphingobium lignivorans]|uniref:Uncharacterized protein n=1 Tax=Sphingobium lignivorans TaxID=2735886 RepID=A0ABR6NFB6_9SPHN|nr:hypothetical protein [Sphingobium lignivorans]MBB5985984.1 hypothetical protein [Sphingobium lignivorans]
MNWPQITAIVLIALSLGIQLAKHGQPREPYSFPAATGAAVIWIVLLGAGGFWG